MNKLQELAKFRSEMEERIRTEGEEAVAEYFRDAFAKFPKIVAVGWTQYTPYFNDGDECVFSVHEPYFKIRGVDSEYDEFLEEYDDEEEGEADGLKFVSLYKLYDSVDWRQSEAPKAHEVGPNDLVRRDFNRYSNSYRYSILRNVRPEGFGAFEIADDLQASEDLLKFALGDHCKVVVTREGIEVTEYDHD
jgi:hypothetical protein